jgi:sugar/nucleoside kinase (ribokinase family)
LPGLPGGKVETYPPPDGKFEFTDMVIQGGGPVATALVALSRWGISCTFTGVVGDDQFGTFIKASLDEEGEQFSGTDPRVLLQVLMSSITIAFAQLKSFIQTVSLPRHR